MNEDGKIIVLTLTKHILTLTYTNNTIFQKQIMMKTCPDEYPTR